MTKRQIPGRNLRKRRGREHPLWEGGRVTSGNDYVRRYAPDHPRAHGNYVLEHILIASEAMGKPVPESAHVHHVNGDRQDNRPQNLVVCEDAAYHFLLHRRQEALDATGDANARRCGRCCEYGDQGDIYVSPKGRARHRACQRKYMREWKARRAAEAS